MFNKKGIEVLQKLTKLYLDVNSPNEFISIEQYFNDLLLLNKSRIDNCHSYEIMIDFKLKKIILYFEYFSSSYNISIYISNTGFEFNIYLYPDYEIIYSDNNIKIIEICGSQENELYYEDLIYYLTKNKEIDNNLIEVIKFIFDK